MSDGPVSDVNLLNTLSPDVEAAIRAECLAAGVQTVPATSTFAQALRVTKPGTERWPVKTGTDDDVDLVGKNVINGTDYGEGIVEATLEELIAMPRLPEMSDPRGSNPAFQSKRAQPVEIVIWRIDVTIIALKLETDGDYHLELLGDSGETMIGEVPTPTTTFLGASPWMGNIQAARQAVDDQFVSHLSPRDFVVSGNMLVPRSAVSAPAQAVTPAALPASFVTPAAGQEQTMFAFKTKVTPTNARITGVGFFDRVHNQLGVSQANGIELHPVLKIEWL